MNNYLFSPEIDENIKNPFVFISYSHENIDVVRRVKSLAQYLKKKQIPVVFDGDGLKPGVNLNNFMQLIVHENCKHVLIVFDYHYATKIRNQSGGVYYEYSIITGDYENRANKYVPLKIGDNIPNLLRSRVYIEFEKDDNKTFRSVYEAVKDILPTEPKKETKKTIPKKPSSTLVAKKLLSEAGKKYDLKSYEQALKCIEKTLLLTDLSITLSLSAYNLKLMIGIQLEDKSILKSSLAELLPILEKNKISQQKLAIYNVNCALAYRILENEEEYVNCAKVAQIIARKSSMEDCEDYVYTYAGALYETKQYYEAYTQIKEAKKIFMSKYQIIEELREDRIIAMIRILSNFAEIAVVYGERAGKKDKETQCLEEAKQNIYELMKIDCNGKVHLDDKTLQEIYRIASFVFEKLSNYYKPKK